MLLRRPRHWSGDSITKDSKSRAILRFWPTSQAVFRPIPIGELRVLGRPSIAPRIAARPAMRIANDQKPVGP